MWPYKNICGICLYKLHLFYLKQGVIIQYRAPIGLTEIGSLNLRYKLLQGIQ